MRKILFLLLLTLSYASAQDVMRVKLKDGSIQLIPLLTIQKITFSGPMGVDDKTLPAIGSVLKTFSLLQNYPNPFNPTTTISYVIPRTNAVAVRVYDITGRLVRLLVNDVQEAGDHRTQWDGKNDAGQMVASGMYVYEIRFEGSVQARKMMVLK